MQLMHYIFCPKSNAFGNALQFSKSNANAFALLFRQLVERSGADGIYIPISSESAKHQMP